MFIKTNQDNLSCVGSKCRLLPLIRVLFVLDTVYSAV